MYVIESSTEKEKSTIKLAFNNQHHSVLYTPLHTDLRATEALKSRLFKTLKKMLQEAITAPDLHTQL